MSERFPLRYLYGMTAAGTVRHLVLIDDYTRRPERFTVCGRRWAKTIDPRLGGDARLLCDDCQRKRAPGV